MSEDSSEHDDDDDAAGLLFVCGDGGDVDDEHGNVWHGDEDLLGGLLLNRDAQLWHCDNVDQIAGKMLRRHCCRMWDLKTKKMKIAERKEKFFFNFFISFNEI